MIVQDLEFLSFEAFSLTDIALRLFIAALLGGLLGLERQSKHKPLGVRPFVLVAIGSCLSVLAIVEFGLVSAQGDIFSVDPAKVIGGILGGIGFLGAGALFRGDSEIRGAATAASIWLTGAVGVACGIGYAVPAVIAVGLALITLVFVPRHDTRE